MSRATRRVRSRPTVRVPAVWLVAAALSAGGPTAGSAQSPTALQTEVERIVAASSASVGVGIRHLESGREVFVGGDTPFLMGSTFKVAVAVELLTRVDRGSERLDRLVPLLAADLFPSGSLLSERFRDNRDPGAHLALLRHLELMLILSDNAATDVILREIGGPAAVTRRVHALGIEGLRVDRTVMEIYRDYVGIPELPPFERRNLDTLVKLIGSRTPDQLRVAQRAYHAGEQDRATPRAMVSLLAKIARGEALSDSSTRLLLSIMRREEWGVDRLRARLPAGTVVANKTGTYGTVVANDVGIIELPAGRGRLAIAVFTEDDASNERAKERVIADVARAAYDYFLLRGGTR